MSIKTGIITCPYCGKELEIEIKVLKNSVIGNKFKDDSIFCSCGELISINEIYENYFLVDFDEILSEDLEDLESLFSYLEEIEKALGKHIVTEIKKEVLLLRMLMLKEELSSEKFIQVMNALDKNLTVLYSKFKKLVKPWCFDFDFKQDFYMPTNLITKTMNNVVQTQYLLDYFSLCIHFFVVEFIEYIKQNKKEMRPLEYGAFKRINELLYNIEFKTYQIMDYYKYIEWFEESDMLDVLIKISIELCKPLRLRNGKLEGLSALEKEKYIETYDKILKPKQKEIFFNYMNNSLFKTYPGIDRYALTGKIYSREDFQDRKEKVFEEDLRRDSKLICKCIIKDFCTTRGIKITDKDLKNY